jgi:hypothetical protein
MLVNPSGLPGHAMGIDMNIEHLIQYLKVCSILNLVPTLRLILYETLFVAKGIYLNWDRLGNIAAGINYLQLVKKRVMASLKSGYQGSTHTDVNTASLVWHVANKARELGLQTVDTKREANANPIQF